MTDTKNKDNQNSFLTESQKSGQSSGKISIDNLDVALGEITHTIDKEQAQFYREKPEEEWPTSEMVIYCHDCRKIVPLGEGQTIRKKPRIVCGVCKSAKISRGREESLMKFYHLKES